MLGLKTREPGWHKASQDPARRVTSHTAHRYPLAVVGDLDPARPHGVQLLGRQLVLWRDGGGAWRAMADRCPHRLALGCASVERACPQLMQSDCVSSRVGIPHRLGN